MRDAVADAVRALVAARLAARAVPGGPDAIGREDVASVADEAAMLPAQVEALRSWLRVTDTPVGIQALLRRPEQS